MNKTIIHFPVGINIVKTQFNNIFLTKKTKKVPLKNDILFPQRKKHISKQR